MKYAGIDIGSRSIELVVVDEHTEVLENLKTDTGFNPVAQAKNLMTGIPFDRIMATGYGRGLFETAFDHADTVTEIKAHGRVSSQGPIVFSGGVANNPCIRDLMADKLNREVLVPRDPQMIGALGAALILLDRDGDSFDFLRQFN